MIHYTHQGWRFFLFLFRCSGSVLPRVLPLACLSAGGCFLLTFFELYPTNQQTGASLWMAHPNPFAFFLQVSPPTPSRSHPLREHQIAGLTLAFHTNSAYQRFWEARTQIQSMASYWADAASHLIAFDELTLLQPDDTEAAIAPPRTTSSQFRALVVHYMSLLHAMAIQYLLHQDSRGCHLEILGGILCDEAIELEKVRDHAFLVNHWVSQLMIKRHFVAKGIPVGTPVLSRTWQLLYLGMHAYNQACKIEDTPFPFPYIQLMYIFELSVVVTTPVVVSGWVPNIVLAVALTFLVVLTFTSLFHIANFMESPFGQRQNDLPLHEVHADFIARLRALVDPSVADVLAALIREKSIVKSSLDKKSYVPWPCHRSRKENPTVEHDPSGISLTVWIPASFSVDKRRLSKMSGWYSTFPDSNYMTTALKPPTNTLPMDPAEKLSTITSPATQNTPA